ncbi:MAG TPA: hypothetical protein DCZ95_08360 [Verrucomicrobia bacterium]|nr:MAG: hypothetical protein A2X46_12395 [Lentisphaerae bacterium GWF2_57_35]HBA84091.1 hypothetical protein [Verrucomicrobiota bacterium]
MKTLSKIARRWLWLLPACWLTAQSSLAADADANPALRIGYLPIDANLPLVVSFENDQMRFQAGRPSLHQFRSDTAIEAAIRVGAIDVAAVSAPVAYAMAADEVPMLVLGVCHRGGSRLIGRTGGRLEDLRGKVVGVPGLDSSENIRLAQAAAKVGLRPGLDYRTIRVPYRTALDDLKAGRLDAVLFPEPLGALAEDSALGKPMEAGGGLFDGALGAVLVARKDYIREHPEAVNEWLKSIAVACSFIELDIRENGAQQTAIFQSKYMSVPRETAARILAQRAGGLRFEAAAADRALFASYRDTALALHLITRSIELNDVLNLSIIEAALSP